MELIVAQYHGLQHEKRTNRWQEGNGFSVPTRITALPVKYLWAISPFPFRVKVSVAKNNVVNQSHVFWCSARRVAVQQLQGMTVLEHSTSDASKNLAQYRHFVRFLDKTREFFPDKFLKNFLFIVAAGYNYSYS